MKIKIVTIVLALIALSTSVAFADSSVSNLTPMETVCPTEFVNSASEGSVKKDILLETNTRGLSAPTSSTDCPYDYEASFTHEVYTNYYFEPKSDGTLHLSIEGTADGTTTLYYSLYESDGTLCFTINLGRTTSWDTTRLISNLDTDKYYYIKFSKPQNSKRIMIDGSIYH